MFALLLFCGQQGYLTFKDYKKVTKRNQLEEKGFSSEIIEKKIKEMVNH
jgi:hypothetical protein